MRACGRRQGCLSWPLLSPRRKSKTSLRLNCVSSCRSPRTNFRPLNLHVHAAQGLRSRWGFGWESASKPCCLSIMLQNLELNVCTIPSLKAKAAQPTLLRRHFSHLTVSSRHGSKSPPSLPAYMSLRNTSHSTMPHSLSVGRLCAQ